MNRTSRSSLARRRLAGYVCHVGLSRSCGFWAIIKSDDRAPHFAYGKCFMAFPAVPAIGTQVTFAPLPPLAGSRYPRAIEVAAFVRPTPPSFETPAQHATP